MQQSDDPKTRLERILTEGLAQVAPGAPAQAVKVEAKQGA